MCKIREVGGCWKEELWSMVLGIGGMVVMSGGVVEVIVLGGEYDKGDLMKGVMGGVEGVDRGGEWYRYWLLRGISG